jgi:CheY-like chemotaxis protein
VKKNILVVDDDQTIISMFEFILTQANYKPITVNSGVICLEKLKAGLSVDLIFLDLKMPVLSGLDTFREILKINSKIPVIMMTGDSIDSLLKEAFELGAYGIIYKPFDVEEVLMIIEKIFNVTKPIL